jgi:hypothetical protein
MKSVIGTDFKKDTGKYLFIHIISIQEEQDNFEKA